MELCFLATANFLLQRQICLEVTGSGICCFQGLARPVLNLLPLRVVSFLFPPQQALQRFDLYSSASFCLPDLHCACSLLLSQATLQALNLKQPAARIGLHLADPCLRCLERCRRRGNRHHSRLLLLPKLQLHGVHLHLPERAHLLLLPHQSLDGIKLHPLCNNGGPLHVYLHTHAVDPRPLLVVILDLLHKLIYLQLPVQRLHGCILQLLGLCFVQALAPLHLGLEALDLRLRVCQ
mmetsp:Transcript_37042/g.103023  ORF Transcript_37042/g.103023 Transcript_37042/m.103023 type:complete len:236 (-) Transcript_37042:948-1655(-)